MKKISIVIEDSEKGKQVIIPVTLKEARHWYDFAFMTEEKDIFLKTLKLNKCDNSFWALHKKAAIIVDAFDEGKTYRLDDLGKRDKVPTKNKFWHSGKPVKWVKKTL